MVVTPLPTAVRGTMVVTPLAVEGPGQGHQCGRDTARGRAPRDYGREAAWRHGPGVGEKRFCTKSNVCSDKTFSHTSYAKTFLHTRTQKRFCTEAFWQCAYVCAFLHASFTRERLRKRTHARTMCV